MGDPATSQQRDNVLELQVRDLLARAEGGEFVSAIFVGQRAGNSICYRNTGSPDRHAQIAALEIEKAILVRQCLGET